MAKRISLPLTEDEKNKKRQTNKETIKKHFDDAKRVDPELADRIESLTNVDQARRRKEQGEK